MTPRVAIVGAGLAGLAAADLLLRRNVAVTLIDEGRQAGGRFHTQSVELSGNRVASFDLGPQLLYTRRRGDGRAPPLNRVPELVQRLPGNNPVLFRQLGQIGGADELTGNNVPPFGVALAGGMRELAFRVLSVHRDGIDFRDHARAERLERTSSGWRIHTRSLRDGFETIVLASALILTAPVPQALELLAASKLDLPDELIAQLRAVEYARCLALYGMFTGTGSIPEGGVWPGGGPVAWVTENRTKGTSAVGPAITAITTEEWAAAHWSNPDARLIEQLLPLIRPWAGDPEPETRVAIQRWKWARPVNPLRALCSVVRDLGLVLAGDGFSGTAPDPADGAILSGEAAATRVTGLLTALARRDDRLTLARPRRFTLEIAVSTGDEAVRAHAGGADRLELSSGLEVGGLTPSLGTFHEIREVSSLPVYVLSRPRPGGFTYSEREFAGMLRDAETFMGAGARGLVFGVFHAYGGIDHRRCKKLVEIAGEHAVFHRAFDFLPDPLTALDELIELGFKRVLTSGHGSTAEAGATRLATLVQHAGWEIEVLPAGNVRPENVFDLVRETRCEQVHSSARSPIADLELAAAPRLAAGMGTDASGMRQTTDVDLVAGLRVELDRLTRDLGAE